MPFAQTPSSQTTITKQPTSVVPISLKNLETSQQKASLTRHRKQLRLHLPVFAQQKTSLAQQRRADVQLNRPFAEQNPLLGNHVKIEVHL